MTDYNELTIQDFKGSCFGVRLKKRGEKDPEIMFSILVEDDDNWFESKYIHQGSACFWMNDFITQMRHAFEFLNEDSRVEKHQWGYKWIG